MSGGHEADVAVQGQRIERRERVAPERRGVRQHTRAPRSGDTRYESIGTRRRSRVNCESAARKRRGARAEAEAIEEAFFSGGPSGTERRPKRPGGVGVRRLHHEWRRTRQSQEKSWYHMHIALERLRLTSRTRTLAHDTISVSGVSHRSGHAQPLNHQLKLRRRMYSYYYGWDRTLRAMGASDDAGGSL